MEIESRTCEYSLTLQVDYRTMQTAVGVFGGGGVEDGINVAPLMTENAGKSGRPAISSQNSPPYVAMELCREHLVCND